MGGRALDKKKEVQAILAKARALPQAREDNDGPATPAFHGRPGTPMGVRPGVPVSPRAANPLLPAAWRVLQGAVGRGLRGIASGSTPKLEASRPLLIQAKKEGSVDKDDVIPIPVLKPASPPPEVLGKLKKEKKEKKE